MIHGKESLSVFLLTAQMRCPVLGGGFIRMEVL